MLRIRAILSALVAIGVLILCRAAQADESAIERCIAASGASIEADNLHHLHAERAELLACAAAECPLEVRTECLRRIEEVNRAVPTLVFEARDPAGNDLSAVEVTMDGQVLTDRLDGVALSIDPGAHEFTFEVKGQPPVRKQFVIREGQKDRHERITLGRVKKNVMHGDASFGAGQRGAPASDRRDSGALGAQKFWAIGIAGLGIAGVAVGAVFGADALSKRDEAEKVCPDACADSRGVERWHDAKTTGNRATVAFAVGGALLAGAGLLWLTAPGDPATRHLELGLGAGTVSMRSQW